MVFDMGEFDFLDTDNVALRDKVDERPVDKLLASTTRGIRAVVGKAMRVEGANTGVEGNGVGEGGNRRRV